MSVRAAPLPRPSTNLALPVALAVAALAAPALLFSPTLAVGGIASVALAIVVFVRPTIGAYLLVGVTPLVVGLNRGGLLPGLRPSEALDFLVAGAVAARGIAAYVQGQRIAIRIRTTDASLLALVLTGSVLPLAWMVMRGRHLTGDDVLYAVALWKYAAIYLVVRTAVRSEREVARCLSISMVAGAVVAVIGVLQAVNLFGVPQLLASHFAPYGDVEALQINRGSSTIASPQAMADVMVFNLAIALGWLHVRCGRRGLVVAAAGLFTIGALASGQFSGAIALVVGVAAVGLVTGRVERAGLTLLPAGLFGAIALRPVIERRLAGFSSPEGLPTSWVGRLHNLQTYFWPELRSHWQWVLGVRPAARISCDAIPWGKQDCLMTATDRYVFIESGHTWLLWTGGVPFLAAFVAFLWTNLKAAARVARRRTDALSIAGVATFAAFVVVAVLMTFDPHLTLRGGADLSFALLGLTHAAFRLPAASEHEVVPAATENKQEGSPVTAP